MRSPSAFSALVAAVLLSASVAHARDWYVSASRGKGKKATKDKPAKDMGNIASMVAAGDVVHIAQGTYLGRGESGSVKFTVPVSVIGGYDEAFAKRDPWGAHRTILAGNNMTKNYTVEPTLYYDLSKYTGDASAITVDGVIVDMGARNRYADDKQLKLIPMANPKTGANPSPGLGAMVIRVSKSGKFDAGPRWEITVRNCVVINHYGNQGALSVSGFKGSKITLDNNIVAQFSGVGLFIGSKFQGKDSFPQFNVTNNTVLFAWDSGFSQGFNISFDNATQAVVRNNVFAFSDIYAVNNERGAKNLLLADNIITGARKADYVEGNTRMDVGNMEDEAERLHGDSGGNITDKIVVPVSKEFATAYGSRVVVDREKAEADVKASNSDANTLRGMLGLPLQAGSVKWPDAEVYINRISVDDAIKAGSARYKGKYGASMPHP